jgi:hypothetical protein
MCLPTGTILRSKFGLAAAAPNAITAKPAFMIDEYILALYIPI